MAGPEFGDKPQMKTQRHTGVTAQETEPQPRPSPPSGDSSPQSMAARVSSEINHRYGMAEMRSGPMAGHLHARMQNAMEGIDAAPEISIAPEEPEPHTAKPASTLRVSPGFEGDRSELQRMLDAIEDISGLVGPEPPSET